MFESTSDQKISKYFQYFGLELHFNEVSMRNWCFSSLVMRLYLMWQKIKTFKTPCEHRLVFQLFGDDILTNVTTYIAFRTPCANKLVFQLIGDDIVINVTKDKTFKTPSAHRLVFHFFDDDIRHHTFFVI